jgi:hypothetical protein
MSTMRSRNNKINENNRLIAEFMGLKVTLDRRGGYEVYYDIPTEYGRGCIDDLEKYHESWDCLMPVLEKIEGIKPYVRSEITRMILRNITKDVGVGGPYFCTQLNVPNTIHPWSREYSINIFAETRIESLYKAIIR